MAAKYKYSRTKGKFYSGQDDETANDYHGYVNRAGELLLSYWRLYPDRLLALCEAEHPDYRLAPIQALMVRAECRNEECFITGGRGLTKSYTGLISRMLLGVLYPGVRLQYFGPTLKQTAQIISATFKAVTKNYPLLAEHWMVKNDSSERFTIETKYGSQIDVDLMRGTNGNAVFAEEVAQQESGEAFDHEKFRAAVLPAIRVQRTVDGVMDEMFPNFQKCYVTSAGRQQNESYEYRRDILRDMALGKRAFALDIPGEVAVLNGIRNIGWYNDMKRKLTPEEWLREMCARWTGACENPVIRDSTLTESKQCMLMENRHCGDPNVTYIVSNDVSYADGARNAKVATVVLKLEQQPERHKRDRYLKTIVYALDEDPREGLLQAKALKQRWFRFCMDNGQPTYLVIDARSYGQAVLEDLHKDLGDGLPPLCCIDHSRKDIELEGALPVIYAINATGGYYSNNGVNFDHDNDSDMLRYAEVEWEQRNVRVLTSNINEGVMAYKRVHRIKDDLNDPTIAIPYIKCRELCGQIGNLRKKLSGTGFKEERISRAINRDMWSATKYALRVAQRLEYQNLVRGIKKNSAWAKVINGESNLAQEAEEGAKQKGWSAYMQAMPTPRILTRTGGNMRR